MALFRRNKQPETERKLVFLNCQSCGWQSDGDEVEVITATQQLTLAAREQLTRIAEPHYLALGGVDKNISTRTLFRNAAHNIFTIWTDQKSGNQLITPDIQISYNAGNPPKRSLHN